MNQAASIPSLTVIDAPYPPLIPVKKGKLVYSLAFFIGFLILGYFIFRIKLIIS